MLSLLLAGCAGESASKYDAALAALREGELRQADSHARESTEMRAGFLRGNIAFAQCLLAEEQAVTMAAEPFAWDIAIQYADHALGHWAQAAASRDDWPEARRNVERALLKLDDLRRKKAKAEEELKRKSEPQPRPQPQPQAQPAGGDQKITEDAEIEAQMKPLSEEQVTQLLDRLAAKEKEKRTLREKEGAKRLADGELGW